MQLLFSESGSVRGRQAVLIEYFVCDHYAYLVSPTIKWVTKGKNRMIGIEQIVIYTGLFSEEYQIYYNG